MNLKCKTGIGIPIFSANKLNMMLTTCQLKRVEVTKREIKGLALKVSAIQGKGILTQVKTVQTKISQEKKKKKTAHASSPKTGGIVGTLPFPTIELIRALKKNRFDLKKSG